jgi:hypothetical protein
MFQFQDEYGIFTVYKHSDGGPHWAAEAIKEALPYAWPLPRFEADEFAAAFVAGCKVTHRKIRQNAGLDDAGGYIRLVPRSDKMAWQWAPDIEYRYLVQLKRDRLIVECWAVERDWKTREWSQARIFRGSIDRLAKVVRKHSPKMRKIEPERTRVRRVVQI